MTPHPGNVRSVPKTHAVEMVDELIVRPGEPARLSERSPASHLGLGDKTDGQLLEEVLASCLARVPRPEPDWEAGAAPEAQ